MLATPKKAVIPNPDLKVSELKAVIIKEVCIYVAQLEFTILFLKFGVKKLILITLSPKIRCKITTFQLHGQTYLIITM